MIEKMIVFDKKSFVNKIYIKGIVIGDCIIDDGESERYGFYE